jgi:uncharacterized protein (TIGR02246 family)
MKLPVHSELVAAFASRDAARVAGLYAEDALFFTPGRPAVRGRSAILDLMKADFEDPGFSLELHEQRTSVSSSGDLAYARGTFRASFTGPGSREVRSVGGNYLQIFRKARDGRWEILEDISSPGAPDAGPPSPGQAG